MDPNSTEYLMKNTRLTRILGILCICALGAATGVACGGDDGGGNNGGGTITPDEFEQTVRDTFASSICTSAYQCAEEQSPEITLVASRYDGQADCAENVLSLFGAELDFNFSSPVEAGLSEFNADKARECVDAVEQLQQDSCYNITAGGDSPAPACDQILTGLQEEGQACDSDDHCASGLCDFSVDTGEACWSGECAAGMSMEPTIRAEGETCGEDNEYCDSGLACDTNEAGDSSICVAIDSRAEGSTCDSAVVCNAGLACIESTCTELELGAEGDACDLQTTFCEAGLVCGFELAQTQLTGSCMPPKDQGAECFQDVSCKAGLQCDGVDQTTGSPGTCEDTLGEGEECDSNFDCQSGLTCQSDGQNSTCEQPPGQETCDIPTGDQMM
jgi:hypothetical protein